MSTDHAAVALRILNAADGMEIAQAMGAIAQAQVHATLAVAQAATQDEPHTEKLSRTRDIINDTLANPTSKLVFERDPHVWAMGLAMAIHGHAS